MAVEYPFWDERTPEALIRFGAAVPGEEIARLGTRDGAARLEVALTDTLDALSKEAMTRDPALFDTLLAGKVGVGGVYDLWRRAKAWSRGERFEAAHNVRAHREDTGS